MKFLAIIVIFFVLFPALFYLSIAKNESYSISDIIIPVFIILIVFLTAKYFLNRRSSKGSALQGIWVLEKNFRFNPVFKKYEAVPVEPKKHYFEFKGKNFRSGDFDEKHKQLPAEYSPFLIEGNNLIIESEFFKNGNWKWLIKDGKLDIHAEMAEPRNSKSQFIFYKKNWH